MSVTGIGHPMNCGVASKDRYPVQKMLPRQANTYGSLNPTLSQYELRIRHERTDMGIRA